MPQKRAALVLDRLLVALQKALHDVPSAPEPRYDRFDRDGPRAAPLRLAPLDYSDTVSPNLSKIISVVIFGGVSARYIRAVTPLFEFTFLCVQSDL